ncbi:hypothetical protein REPUB_Repub12eG0183500 [Reevesia pubescens]
MDLLEYVFPGTCSLLIGLIQRKPGRGDTTMSLSCSDKIARWNIVGIQGGFRQQLLLCCEQPIFCVAPVPVKEFQHFETAQATLTCGFPICWNKSGLHEVILGTIGKKQGTSA